MIASEPFSVEHVSRIRFVSGLDFSRAENGQNTAGFTGCGKLAFGMVL
jgi:hypothetical protein